MSHRSHEFGFGTRREVLKVVLGVSLSGNGMLSRLHASAVDITDPHPQLETSYRRGEAT